MNYGGIDADNKLRSSWGKWQKEFLWFPKRIDKKWYWLREVHYRWRWLSDWRAESLPETAEIQYAVDIFDLMKKDSK